MENVRQWGRCIKTEDAKCISLGVVWGNHNKLLTNLLMPQESAR
jgi:hypothetical protein